MTTTTSAKRGRPFGSSREDIERVAMDLFRSNGYESTTLPMIADAAGISRTSFFRYYSSKAEIIWTPFDAHTAHLRQLLEESDPAIPIMTAVRDSAVAALRGSVDPEGIWLTRFAIQDSSPELRAGESDHWVGWAGTVAEFVAQRCGVPSTKLLPQSIGGAVQAAFITVLRSWIRTNPTADPLEQFRAELTPLTDVLQNWIDESAQAISSAARAEQATPSA